MDVAEEAVALIEKVNRMHDLDSGFIYGGLFDEVVGKGLSLHIIGTPDELKVIKMMHPELEIL